MIASDVPVLHAQWGQILLELTHQVDTPARKEASQSGGSE